MKSKSTLDFVDTHCHLNFDSFDVDRDLVIERAKEIGISKILIPGIDIETSKTAIELAMKFPEVYAAVGMHPNQGLNWNSNTISELRELARKEKVVAIGEIGLDYYRNFSPKNIQQAIFIQQLELAEELQLPIIVHNREASDDILRIIQNWYRRLYNKGIKLVDHPGVMHSFSGDQKFANEVISIKIKIGITGPVTFKNSRHLQSIVKTVPIENIIIETDAPFLTPHPNRGKRNEPANVRIVAEKIAEIKDEPLQKITEITTAEADKLFNWREIH